MSSSWEGRGRGHVEGRTWRPPPLSFVGIERVVFEATTITSSARSCWNGTRGRDEGEMSARRYARSAERNEGRLERVSSARARDLTMTFSSFGSIAQRVGRRALYRRPQRAARPRVSRPPRKNGFRRGKTVQKAFAGVRLAAPAAASVAGPKRVFPVRCDIPTRAKLSRQKVMTANTYISRETGFFPVRGVASWQHHTLPRLQHGESEGLIPREATSPPL